MKSILVSLLFSISLLVSAQTKETVILISTNMGDMKAILYNDTPKHRDHYIKLIKQGYFDGTLFSRVVKGYVVQGGSKDSRGAAPGVKVGYGNSSMELFPEFRKTYFHKKGALCAPRQPNNVNPQRKSDASQFFIVQGTVLTAGQLDTMELAKNLPIKNKAYSQIYNPIKDELNTLKESNPKLYNEKVRAIKAQLDSALMASPNKLIFTPAQREAYTKIGGTPNLDGDYTVFGEVIEGLDVIDKIAALKVNGFDRPFTDVKMKVSIVK